MNEKGEKREKSRLVFVAYIDFGHSDVNQTAQDYDEIEAIPRVTKIILES